MLVYQRVTYWTTILGGIPAPCSDKLHGQGFWCVVNGQRKSLWRPPVDQMLARLVVVPLEFVEMGQLSQCITFIIYIGV